MIIGITGLAGSGKSEVAGYLAAMRGFRRMAFADPLKEMLLAAGFSRAQVYGDLKGEIDALTGKTPRFMMQELGTLWGRQTVHPDLWVRLWERRIDDAVAHYAHVVAEDVRFENEAEAIRARGGQVWRVIRPGVEAMAHVSEKNLVPADAVIRNVAGLHDLHLSIDALLQNPPK